MRYRSRIEIVADILKIASGSRATKTSLMFGACLSYFQIEEYLEYMKERRLITTVPGTDLYKVTEKGLRYIELSKEIIEVENLTSEF